MFAQLEASTKPEWAFLKQHVQNLIKLAAKGFFVIFKHHVHVDDTDGRLYLVDGLQDAAFNLPWALRLRLSVSSNCCCP